jgi:hypothetical protein
MDPLAPGPEPASASEPVRMSFQFYFDVRPSVSSSATARWCAEERLTRLWWDKVAQNKESFFEKNEQR